MPILTINCTNCTKNAINRDFVVAAICASVSMKTENILNNYKVCWSENIADAKMSGRFKIETGETGGIVLRTIY